MQVIATAIPDVRIVIPRCIEDDRGLFVETYNQDALASRGIASRFVQDNYSTSRRRGTLRGLHFQLPPDSEEKLVRVVRGSILDVAVDLRRSSPTFGRHVASVLSAENWKQMFVPKGFAHAYITLEPGTEVAYKVTCAYAPAAARGIAWNDPALGIDWGLPPGEIVASERDRSWPRLADLTEFP